MKSYTTIEQSKKLAEILLLESADILHCIDFDGDLLYTVPKQYSGSFRHQPELIIPCWSLAALLEQIPSDLGSATLTIEKADSEPFKYGLNYHDRWGREDDIQTKYYDDLVDACYEMILKLHELNLLDYGRPE